MTVIDDQLGLIDAEDPTASKEVLTEARREIERLTAALTAKDEALQQQVIRANGAEQAVGVQRTRAEAAERAVEVVQEAHRGDIALIGATLLEEADEREWCDEYDRVINGMNEGLNIKLPIRLRQFTVSARVTFEQDFTVEAHTLEEAEQLVEEAETNRSWRVTSPFISPNIGQSGTYGHSIGIEIV